jgi:hypothetical protein
VFYEWLPWPECVYCMFNILQDWVRENSFIFRYQLNLPKIWRIFKWPLLTVHWPCYCTVHSYFVIRFCGGVCGCLLTSDLIWFWLLVFERHFQQYFSYIMSSSFSGGRSRSAQRKPPTMGKQLVSFITCNCESSAPFCNLHRWTRTHTVLVIGLHELLGNPTT